MKKHLLPLQLGDVRDTYAGSIDFKIDVGYGLIITSMDACSRWARLH